ncbi:MAG: phospholipase D-like domain-containing protein [Spirochaetaceae bacterium]|jgi:superfamily II DNA or RNA helicase|nr:phospholipase D-like domain-containing protein [Spirochaetaceae bacterium]
MPIYDNISGDNLATALKKTLDTAQRADFCIGYFNLRGWDLLLESVDALPGGPLDERFEDDATYKARVLIGMQKHPREELEDYYALKQSVISNEKAARLKKEAAAEFRKQLTIGRPTNKDEETLKKLCRQLKARQVVVKLHLAFPLHAKLYLAYRDDYNAPIIGYLGSSNLTFSGLSKQGELNVDVTDKDSSARLEQWFQDRWDDQYSWDITEDLAKTIDESWAREIPLKPYYVYMKIAYHLSQEARSGIAEFSVPKALRKVLLPFQQNAVQVAARHLHKRGGVMIGDVVGLGKTITAIALAKMFEDDFGYQTLIICPPNLAEMWNDYKLEYGLRAEVLSLGEVQHKLKQTRPFRMVVIDESHNLRNREGRRYRAIHEYLYQAGSKVILLTATPYNKSYLDMGAQLRLFLDEEAGLGISPDRYMREIGGKAAFEARHQVKDSTLAAFEKSAYSEDWSTLMRLFLVRRTRSFIKNNYALTDSANGRKYLAFSGGDKDEIIRSYFPDRVPAKVQYPFRKSDREDQYARLYSSDVVNVINRLRLPRYGLGHEDYEDKEAITSITTEESTIKDKLAKAGKQLRGFARTNLFKRLESSGHSFLLSLSRHILRNYLFLYAIENDLAFPVGKQDGDIISEILYTDEDPESGGVDRFISSEAEYMHLAKEYYETLSYQKQKYEWIRSALFNETFKKDIEADTSELLTIMEKNKIWDPSKDRQLNALSDLVSKKYAGEKIIVFTQYADTAHYLYHALKKRGVRDLERVTGSSENATNIAHRFSPESNKKHLGKKQFAPSMPGEIRVLIATDVLSEGQNLQDCHIVVNYDLPWAIIRLIQRAGRVDRIGQKSDTIYCYSFLPEDGLETILALRGRLQKRIKENAEAVGSDEVFFDGDPVNIKDLYNEKAGILDDEDDDDVDLASYCYQLWQNGCEKHPELKKIIPELPDVVYATKKKEGEVSPSLQPPAASFATPSAGDTPATPPWRSAGDGVIVYAQTGDGNDSLAWMETRTETGTGTEEKGHLVSQSPLEILKALKCGYDEPPLPRQEHHHTLTAEAIAYLSEFNDKIGGQLGKRNGARYRAFTRLEQWLHANKDGLFITEEIKHIHEDLYRFPLKEDAVDAINRELKSGIDDEKLVEMLCSLNGEDKLCVKTEDKPETKEARIICSMGLA